jgi:hypothetical protein
VEVSPKFLRFAAVCALITALTTLAIHLMPYLWADADTFEKQLDLRNRALYLTRLWIVLVHCLLVVVSMYAICLLSVRTKPGWAGLGFLAFFVFALTEIFRTSLALFALNRTWRTRFAANPDPEARGSIRALIEAFSGINDALFFIFIVAFFLGLLCYGVALATDKTSERAMGFLFLTWAVLTLPALIDAVRGVDSISGMFEWVGYGFQPIARASIGLWLWKKSSALHRAPTAREIARPEQG